MNQWIICFQKRCWAALCIALLTGCYKNHLYVQQEWIDRKFLASSHVNTPDPRQEHPRLGQRLLVSWDFPRSLFQEQLSLQITVRLWDNTQELICHPIERKRDVAAFFFSNPGEEMDSRILTYRVQVVSKDGNVLETWNHHFWTEWIDIDRSAAIERRISVSDQPKQGSVMETP
ncbi:MAG: hypothetical protein V4487_02405 [Chlamydiota bacterium]